MKIKIDESLDILKIPIISIYIGNKQYDMILDTGSDSSYIDSSVIDDIEDKELVGKQGCLISGSGTNNNSMPIYSISFRCCDHDFNDYFSINDFSDSFNFIKNNHNITLHGIIGCDFMDKNKAIIDFNDKVFYV